MNYRDILLNRSPDPFEEMLKYTYDLLCRNELDRNILKEDLFQDSFTDIEISEEDRKEILDYIENLDLRYENRELFDEYEELELMELMETKNDNF